jgi:hypothetical protein
MILACLLRRGGAQYEVDNGGSREGVSGGGVVAGEGVGAGWGDPLRYWEVIYVALNHAFSIDLGHGGGVKQIDECIFLRCVFIE